MKQFFAFLLAVVALAAPRSAFTQESPLSQLPWQFGPTTGKLGSRASIEVPKGYAFLGPEGTRQLNVLMQNPDSGEDSYTFAPEDMTWTAYFQFSETGYIKDNESLDANEILSSVRAGTNQANVERRKNGWDELNVVGWSFEPKYDSSTKSLEWAILAETEKSKQQIVNYNTRLLGRKGVMEVVVVATPQDLNQSIAAFKGLLPGYDFASGEKYSEFKPGDHVAEYGLAALITGGAAAVATKKGFFGAIAAFLAAAWKFVLAGLVGLGAWLKSLFSRKQDKKRQQ
jgi:uncharacterized membrane-anchored protein